MNRISFRRATNAPVLYTTIVDVVATVVVVGLATTAVVGVVAGLAATVVVAAFDSREYARLSRRVEIAAALADRLMTVAGVLLPCSERGFYVALWQGDFRELPPRIRLAKTVSVLLHSVPRLWMLHLADRSAASVTHTAPVSRLEARPVGDWVGRVLVSWTGGLRAVRRIYRTPAAVWSRRHGRRFQSKTSVDAGEIP